MGKKKEHNPYRQLKKQYPDYLAAVQALGTAVRHAGPLDDAVPADPARRRGSHSLRGRGAQPCQAGPGSRRYARADPSRTDRG
ncbi:hypothetical protein [Pseudomonas sp. VI4.1]|uniref:hypothetical protein n=1 Tax=Pseudomonas sp. VI4.1 TaxID=1941346 RepID=UPI002113D255|nr:hypothetical protein [Pseudomonas sp. VI4.1]